MGMNNFGTVSTAATTIDTGEVRWAAQELSAIIRQLDPDSPAGMLLRQARRELQSLVVAENSVGVPMTPTLVAA